MVVDIQIKFTDSIMAVPGKELACGPFGLALIAEVFRILNSTIEDQDCLLMDAISLKSLMLSTDYDVEHYQCYADEAHYYEIDEAHVQADAQADAEMGAYFQDDPGCPDDYFHG